MTVRMRLQPGARPIAVGVADARCPLRECFWPREHWIRSAAGASGCSSRASGNYECGTRDARGCPAASGSIEPMDLPGWRRVRGVWERVA